MEADILGTAHGDRSETSRLSEAPDTEIKLENRVLSALASLLHYLGALMLAVMCAVICADAISRLAFNLPFQGTAEIVASLLVAVTCLQLPYALVKNALLRATFLLDLVSGRFRYLLDMLAYGVGFVFFSTISLTSVHPLIQSFETMEYAGTLDFQIPQWPIRLVALVLWGISAIVCAAFVSEVFNKARREVKQ